jgi:RNA polymerase sigma-70 factor (ECF subfamily)
MVDPAQPDLVKGLMRADPQAFDAAYERLRAPLYAFLVRLSGQRALAEDPLQETWLRLARRATELPVDAELRPWLFTVARNLYISHRRWALLDAQRLRELGVLPEAALTSPFEALAATETQRSLEKGLLGLPLKNREVCWCVAFLALSRPRPPASWA